MKVFYSENTGADRRGSISAHALLRFALQICGYETQNTERMSCGKPYCPNGPEFSLSHTSSHVMCVISELPCGCDIEALRSINPSVVRRVLTERERGELKCEEDFFKYWCLKESLYKCFGDVQSPYSEEFTVCGGVRCITHPELVCALFEHIPGVCAACCGYEMPEQPIYVPYLKLDNFLQKL